MRRILVVEDEIDLLENIAELLRTEGYEVLEAKDGENAVRQAWKNKPDLILCDILLPKIDGFTVLSILSKDPQTAIIPFIFLTAMTERADMRRGMTLGADDYITKPFTRTELLQAIEIRFKKRELMERETNRKLAELRASITQSLPQEVLTSLSVILGYSEMLIDEKNSVQTPELAREIYRSGNRLLRLVQNYLALADVQRFKTDHNLRKQLKDSRILSVRELVSEMSAQKASSEGRLDDLQLSMDDSPLMISEAHLLKIVEEILDNALRYSPEGTRIMIIGEKSDSYYLLQVRDSGRGIPADQLKWLNNGPEPGNSGLGLVIVNQLLDLYGGQLIIESEYGQETQVKVLLPLSFPT